MKTKTLEMLSKKRLPIPFSQLDFEDKEWLYSLGYNQIRYFIFRGNGGKSGYYLTTCECLRGKLIGTF